MYEMKCKMKVPGAVADLSKREVFIMSKKELKTWQKLLLSETMAGKSDSHRIAYIAVFTAFCVVSNMFFESSWRKRNFRSPYSCPL